MKRTYFNRCGLLLLVPLILNNQNPVVAQTHVCPTLTSRNDGNGQSNSCPGVNATPIDPDVVGTSYHAVPAGNKTADAIFTFSASDLWATAPPVILITYETTSGTTTVVEANPGPPGVPDASHNVKYCFYAGSSGTGNLPNGHIVSIRFATPTQISNHLTCSFDFSNANASVANPSGVPLLVKFYSFVANCLNDKITLRWTTSVDKLSDMFEIERSYNGADFTRLDVMKAANDLSKNTIDYFYEDKITDQLPSNLYYRIKQIDYDGKFAYSPIQKINLINKKDDLQIYLVETLLTIKSSNTEEGRLQFYTMDGRFIKEEQLQLIPGLTSVRNMSNEPASAQLIRLITKSAVKTIKYQ